MAATRPLEDFEIQKIFDCTTGTYANQNKTLLVVGIGLALRATELVSLTGGDVAGANGAPHPVGPSLMPKRNSLK